MIDSNPRVRRGRRTPPLLEGIALPLAPRLGS